MTGSNQRLQVFYDGGCPLCRREIAFYMRRGGADQISWVDVSASRAEHVAPGLSRCDALARFHVLTACGRLVSGAEAFATLWTELPAFRPVGRIIKTRPMTFILEPTYMLFLKFRPRLQSLFGHA